MGNHAQRSVYSQRWNEEPGIWYVRQGAGGNKPAAMYRWHPTINAICEPLLGASVRVREEEVIDGVTQVKEIIIGVDYPRKIRRLRLFKEALDVVRIFRNQEDLFTLAVYRRQVTKTGNMHLDPAFIELAETFDLLAEDWRKLAERMPRRSRILAHCEARANKGIAPVALAAE